MGKIIELTDIADTKLSELLGREDRDDLALRIAVQPGGCSGLIYEMFFDERLFEDDSEELSELGVRVLVDKMSRPYLEGSSLDYSDDLSSQGFKLTNPNAEDSCACGGSFS